MKEIKVIDKKGALMFKLKSSNKIYEDAIRAVSFAESDARYWQSQINYCISLLADLQGEKGEEFARRRRREMKDNGACDYYDEFGRMAYLTTDDLRREVDSEIYRLKKKLASAEETLAEKQAELERVRLILAEDEARIFEPIVEWKLEDDEDDLVF